MKAEAPDSPEGGFKEKKIASYSCDLIFCLTSYIFYSIYLITTDRQK